ncbi:tetratricopeptide repeat-containing sensor histidine kinase [Litoribaculum gwangyangense]|uniref:histidine kinase n=1 Tax=Litoribaculum gwangyangense TaxID=1130722 RepID=A0ABP9CM42_9FLAO
MRCKFLIQAILFSSIISFSQNSEEIIDSLKIELNKSQNDNVRAKIYGDLTWYYSSVSTDSALVYGEKAMIYAEKLKDSTLLAQTISDVGVVYYLRGDYDVSEQLYRKSLKIRKEIKDFAGIASLNYKLGNILYKKALPDSSMIYFLKALDFYERARADMIVNSVQSNIATVLMTLKNYDKALEYFDKNIAFFEKNNQQEMLANVLINKASVLLYKTDTIQAVFHLKKSIEVAKKVKAFTALGSAFNNLGSIYNDKKDFKKAKEFILKSIEIRETASLKTELESSKLTLAGIYSALGEFDKAKPILLENIKVFIKEGVKEKLPLVYLQLIPVYAYQSKPDSVAFYTNKYIKIQEEMAQESMQNITSELETKYQTEKKEKEILEQRTDLAEKELNINQKNTQIMGLGILALVLSLLGYLLYKQQKLKNQQLQKEGELKEALVKIETQNKLQEQRLTISRDLHDNIGAQLTFIISSIDNLQYGFKINNEKITSKLSSISNFTKETIYELRDTIWAMNKSEISLEDLETRVTNYIEKANIASANTIFQFNVDSNSSNEIVFSSVQGMNIYRIIQEAINNSIKYAEATSIKVNFKHLNNQFEISILDDGKGFNIGKVEFGNGLNSMKKRAEDIGATITFNSSNDGTHINLKI